MKTRNAVAAVILAALVSSPSSHLGAQEDEYGLSNAARLGYGALAGLSTYMAYTGPSGAGWLISDESAVFVGIGLGFVTALGVRTLASDLASDEPLRPRMILTGGIGSAGMDSGRASDYQIGVRWPTGERRWMESTLLIVSRNDQTLRPNTGCGFFGCNTGYAVTNSADEQVLALLTRARFAVGDDTPGSFSVGAGPALVHSYTGAGEVDGRGVMVEVEGQASTVGQSQWTLGAGFRFTPIGNVPTIDVDNPSLYVRLGVAVGG